MNSLQHGATLVGLVFELVAGRLLKLDNLGTNSSADLCPDGYCSRSAMYVESKACGAGGRFLIAREQLNRYIQATTQESVQVLYTFWSYSHPLPVGNCKPKRRVADVIENVRSTVKWVYLLDGRIVHALSRAAAEGKMDGASNRHAVMRFHGRPVFERDYLTLSARFLERLRADPARVLPNELKLPSGDWEWRESRQTRGTAFRFNGVDFRTNPYRVFSIRERVPF